MDISILLKTVGVGILVAVANQILQKSGRDELFAELFICKSNIMKGHKAVAVMLTELVLAQFVQFFVKIECLGMISEDIRNIRHGVHRFEGIVIICAEILYAPFKNREHPVCRFFIFHIR